MPTKIEWCTEVWNPVTGCTKVSEGCRNCYAERMSKRLRGRCGYPEDEPFRVTLRPERLEQPLHWRKPRVVFVCSMGDLFHEDVPEEFLDNVFSVVARAHQHVFLILTKRPERMRRTMTGYARGACEVGGMYPWDHVWLGVSVENQSTADGRIPILLDTPAAHRFVSVEPMLGQVDLFTSFFSVVDENGEPSGPRCGTDGSLVIDWVICGGETGPGARPMHPDWVRSLRDQCREAGAPFFFKQMAQRERIPNDLTIREFPDGMKGGL